VSSTVFSSDPQPEVDAISQEVMSNLSQGLPRLFGDNNINVEEKVVNLMDGQSARHFALVCRKAYALVIKRARVKLKSSINLESVEFLKLLHPKKLLQPNLQGLGFSFCNLYSPKSFFPLLENLTLLKELNLGNSTVGYHTWVNSLAAVIGKLTMLETLILVDNKIGEPGLQILAPSLGRLTSLTTLGLGDNPIGPQGMRLLAPELGKLTLLRALGLNKTELGDEGVKSFVPILGVLTSLRLLGLANNSISFQGAQSLAPALGRLTSLTNLGLYWNNLGSQGVQSLAPALGKLTSLISLGLADCKMGWGVYEKDLQGVQSLASELEKLILLTELGLSGNKIGPMGALQLAPALGRLTSLTSLGLASNEIGPKGLTSLVPELKKLPFLTDLNLSYNSIGFLGFIYIKSAELFLRMPDAILDLKENLIPDSVKKEQHPSYIKL